jgi:hypothetical protein
MKIAINKEHIALILLITMIFGGCATPLSKPTVAEQWASTANVSREDIIKLSYCYYAKIWSWTKEPLFIKGVFMMTREVILLYPGRDTKDISKERELMFEMEIKEIERVAFLSQFFFRNIQQLQLKYGDHVILIELRTNNDYPNKVGSDFVYDYLLIRGVRPFESERRIDHYANSGIHPLVICLSPIICFTGP